MMGGGLIDDSDTTWRVEMASDVEPRRLNRWSECNDDGLFIATGCPWCGAAIGPYRPEADTRKEADVFTCSHCGREAEICRNSDGNFFSQALMSLGDVAYLQWRAEQGRPARGEDLVR